MKPLRWLADSAVQWYWGVVKDKPFSEINQLVTPSPILAYYHRNKELDIQCNASSLNLGAVLMQ